jgi:hypothetical protein
MTEKSAYLIRLGVGSFRAHRQSAAQRLGLIGNAGMGQIIYEAGGNLGNVDKSVFSASIDQ